jgi:RecJ-like exonuclease
MKIETKFSLEDKVFIIHKHGNYQFVTCKACQGNGGVEIKGNKFQCTVCYGKGGQKEWVPEKWQVTYKNTKVGRVTVEKYSEEYYQNYPEERQREIRYMVAATGIGSGNVWYEKDVFKTLKEAEAECAKRNAEESKQEKL